jgi:hypothetical protein
MPSSKVKREFLSSHVPTRFSSLRFLNQGGQKVVQNQLRQLHLESGAILYTCPGGIKRKRVDRARISGRSSRVNAQLAISFEIAIIAPQMTGKTLGHTASRPLLHLSFWMVLGVVSFLQTPAPSAEVLELTEVIAHPQHYDRKEVVVIGQVNGVQAITDKQGQPAFQFLLKDNAGTLKVTSRTPVRDGEQVIVEGTFTRRRQGGRIAVYNEVTAVVVRPLTELVADLVG